MKRHILLLVPIILVCIFSSTALGIQNDPKGFRGLKWGTTLSSIQEDMIYVNDIDLGEALGLGSSFVYKMYNRQNDKMSLGSISLSNILYLFYNNQCEGMIAFLENNDDFQSAQIMLGDRFGSYDNFFPVGNGLSKYEWVGNQGVVVLEYDPQGSIIWILSRKMIDIQNKARVENLENDF